MKKRIIRIEERATLSKLLKICERDKTCEWVMFSDMTTQSTGIMSKHQLEEKYEKMEGITYGEKEMYMEKGR